MMKKNNIRKGLAAMLLGVATTASLSAQTVLLNDNFDDGKRNGVRVAGPGEVLPQSGWYESANGISSAATNSLVFTGNGLEVAYFQPVTMQVGETLTMTFDVSYSSANNVTNSLRFGMTNSHMTRTTADGQDGTVGLRTDDSGMYLGINPRNTVGNSRQYFTTGEVKTDLFFQGTNLFSGGLQNTLFSNTVNTVTYQYTLVSASELTLKIEITGDVNDPLANLGWQRTITSADSQFTTTFDTVGLYNSDGNQASFDNINVTYSGMIPEASNSAMMLGLGGVLCALYVRRRKA